MPGRRTGPTSFEQKMAQHADRAFLGGLDGVSALPSPVLPEVESVLGGATNTPVYFYQDEFVMSGGVQNLTLSHSPLAYSEHVYRHPGGSTSDGLYYRQGKAWKRDSGSRVLQVLTGMNARAGDVVVVEYAYYANDAMSVMPPLPASPEPEPQPPPPPPSVPWPIPLHRFTGLRANGTQGVASYMYAADMYLDGVRVPYSHENTWGGHNARSINGNLTFFNIHLRTLLGWEIFLFDLAGLGSDYKLRVWHTVPLDFPFRMRYRRDNYSGVGYGYDVDPMLPSGDAGAPSATDYFNAPTSRFWKMDLSFTTPRPSGITYVPGELMFAWGF